MTGQNKHKNSSRRSTPSTSTATYSSTCEQLMTDLDNIPTIPTSMIDNTLMALRGLFSRSTQHLATLKFTLATERSACAVTREENMQLIQRNGALRAENDMLKAQLQGLEVHVGRIRDEKDALERICLRMKAREMAASQQTSTVSVHTPRPPRRRRAEAFPPVPPRNRRVHPYASSTETLVDDSDLAQMSPSASSRDSCSPSPPARCRTLPRTKSAPAGLALQASAAGQAPCVSQPPAAPFSDMPTAHCTVENAADKLSSSCVELERFLAANPAPPRLSVLFPLARDLSAGRQEHVRPSSTPLPCHPTRADIPMDVDEAPHILAHSAPSGKPRHAAIVLDPSPSA
ncbi:hypothetical protein HDZ31DRAFT_61197 [Schizophyllum fasciatum]